MSVESLNKKLSKQTAYDRLKWVFKYFNEDDIVFTSAFGSYSAAYIHLASTVNPKLNVHFIDTGFHFKETWEFAKELESRLKIQITVIKNEKNAKEFYSNYTKTPYALDVNACCHFHKVEALNSLLYGKKIWLTGIQAYQNKNRENQSILQLHKSGVYKLSPILDWSKETVLNYLEEYKLPLHPLYEKGYLSIGCEPCTRVAIDPDDERSGRWSNTSKTECGLHL